MRRTLFAALLAASVATARIALGACASDAECTTAPLVHCDRLLAAPICVECLADGDCANDLFCERQASRASYGKCVQCTDKRVDRCTSLAQGVACLSAGTCGCVRDQDCGDAPNGRVCSSGVCTTGCRGDGSRPCQPGERCTGLAGALGVCVREPVIPPVRDDDAGDAAPGPTLAAGGNCAVGAAPIGSQGGSEGRLGVVGSLGIAGIAAALRTWNRTRRSRLRSRTGVMATCSAIACLLFGCSRTPTPLRPGLEGSVGLPHKGVLVGGAKVDETDSLKFLRDNERRWATQRFGRALVRAAERVAAERPGGILVVGDLSAKGGGTLMPHLSHRSGRDADLLLYMTTLEGAPVRSPGFVHVREDGLAWDEHGKRFLRFDVERQWLLLKALLSDEEATVQFVFASKTLRLLLAEWAVARGEPTEIVYRAVTVLVQPNPGGEHDDHFHVRTACTLDEIGSGCEPSGPERPWLAALHAKSQDAQREDGAELARSLFEPLAPIGEASGVTASAHPSAPPSVRGAP